MNEIPLETVKHLVKMLYRDYNENDLEKPIFGQVEITELMPLIEN